jgi:hypothetical protein
LIGDELVEISVGEHAAGTLGAVTDDDVAEIASGDVTVQRLDGAAELRRCLGRRAQPTRRGEARLALAGRPSWRVRDVGGSGGLYCCLVLVHDVAEPLRTRGVETVVPPIHLRHAAASPLLSPRTVAFFVNRVFAEGGLIHSRDQRFTRSRGTLERFGLKTPFRGGSTMNGLWRFNRQRRLAREAEDAYRRGDTQSSLDLDRAAQDELVQMYARRLEREPAARERED